jgi:hypothetical protein
MFSENPVEPAEVQFALQTRILLKMGIPFDDPRLKLALLQLHLWPQLVFDPIKGDDGKYLVEVRVIEAEHVVEFNLTLESMPVGEDLAKRAGALVEWVQQLLGEDWAVNIYNRKTKKSQYKIIHKGARRKPIEAQPPTLADAPFPEAVQNFRRYSQNNKTFCPDDDMDLGPIL